jgi:integrase
MSRGERVAPPKQKFGEWAEEWLASLDKRPRTIEAYRYSLDKHLLPRFKNRKLADISPDDIARMAADMAKDDSGWTIHGTLSTMSGCMGRAKRRNMIPANPVRELERGERPKVGGDEKRVLTEPEIGAVLTKATTGFRPMLATMIFGGLRLGETLALTWKDIDYEAGIIHVRRQLDRHRQATDLKTGAARRDVILVPQLATMLKTHYMASLRKQAADYVFAAPDGRGRDHRSTARAIERSFARAGLEGQGLSAHSLRYSFASLLITGLRYDPVMVAAQLGHASPTTTLGIYAHLFDRTKQADELRDQLSEGFGHLLAAASS